MYLKDKYFILTGLLCGLAFSQMEKLLNTIQKNLYIYQQVNITTFVHWQKRIKISFGSVRKKDLSSKHVFVNYHHLKEQLSILAGIQLTHQTCNSHDSIKYQSNKPICIKRILQSNLSLLDILVIVISCCLHQGFVVKKLQSVHLLAILVSLFICHLG